MAKPQQTFEEHWRARHRRGLDAAHRRVLEGVSDPEWIKLDLDDLFSAADVYEKAMGWRDEDLDEDSHYRWIQVFRKTWSREVRRQGTSLVLCDAFDAALKAALLATGESWPADGAASVTEKVTSIARRRAA